MVATRERLTNHSDYAENPLEYEPDITDNYSIYRAELGKRELLTLADEKILGKRIERGRLVESFSDFLNNTNTESIPIIGSKNITESICHAIGIGDYVQFVIDIPKKAKESKLSRNKQQVAPDSDTVVAIEITNPQAVRQQLDSPKVQRYFTFLLEEAEEAKETFIKKNLRLVIKVAQRFIFPGFVPPGAEFLDLIQEGNIGLKKAVDKYQCWRGSKFSTYATWWIRQGIKRSIYNNGRTIRYPEEVQKDLEKLEKAEEEHLEATGALPTEEELSESSGVPMERLRYVREINEILEHTESLDAPKYPYEEDESTVGDFVADKGADTHKEAEDNILKELMQELLDGLSNKQRATIIRYYGLDGEGGRTFEEIAEENGVTYQAVNQVVAGVLKRWREDPSIAEKLLPWYGGEPTGKFKSRQRQRIAT